MECRSAGDETVERDGKGDIGRPCDGHRLTLRWSCWIGIEVKRVFEITVHQFGELVIKDTCELIQVLLFDEPTADH